MVYYVIYANLYILLYLKIIQVKRDSLSCILGNFETLCETHKYVTRRGCADVCTEYPCCIVSSVTDENLLSNDILVLNKATADIGTNNKVSNDSNSMVSYIYLLLKLLSRKLHE